MTAYLITLTINNRVVYMGEHQSHQRGRAIAKRYAKRYYPDQTPTITITK